MTPYTIQYQIKQANTLETVYVVQSGKRATIKWINFSNVSTEVGVNASVKVAPRDQEDKPFHTINANLYLPPVVVGKNNDPIVLDGEDKDDIIWDERTNFRVKSDSTSLIIIISLEEEDKN